MAIKSNQTDFSAVPDSSLKSQETEKPVKAGEVQPSLITIDRDAANSHLVPMSSKQRMEPVTQKEDHSPLAAPPGYSAAAATSPQGLQTKSDINKEERGSVKDREADASEMSHQNPEEKSDIFDSGARWHQVQQYLWFRHGAGSRFILLLTATLIAIVFVANAFTNLKEKNKPTSNLSSGQLGHTQSPIVETTHSASGNQKIMKVSFQNPSNFAFQQLIRSTENHHTSLSRSVRTTGEIHIKPATDDLEPNIQVDIEFHFSDPRLTDFASLSHTESGLVIETPDELPHSLSSIFSSRWIHINATIRVSRNTSVHDFLVKTHSLSLTFHPDLTLHATSLITLSTTSGTIHLPPTPQLNAREIIITTTSGSITGTYPLYDLLSITTLSGSISISLTLHPALPSHPHHPATLHITSASSSIHVLTPALSFPNPNIIIPPRTFHTQISTQSGSLTTTLLHGTSTSLRSASGRILASLHPINTPSHLTTYSISGSTDLTLYPSLSPLRNLSATHKTVSGALTVTYPAQWEGTIEARSVSGRVGIEWEGTRIVRDWKGVTGREILATRGTGDARLEVEGVSGSVSVRGG